MAVASSHDSICKATSTRATYESFDDGQAWATVEDLSISIRLFLATMAIVWGMDGIAVKSVRALFCPVLSEISNINEYMEEDSHIGKKKMYRLELSKLYLEDVKSTWNSLLLRAYVETEYEFKSASVCHPTIQST